MDGGAGGYGQGQLQQSQQQQRQQKQHKLTNRYEQDVQVAFPLKPVAEDGDGDGAEAGPWLSEEDYQTYSVRGATDKWRDGLRRRVGVYKLMATHPDSRIVRAIFEPRGSRAAAGAAAGSGRQQQQQQRGREEGKAGGKRRRMWPEDGGGRGGGGYGSEGEGGSDEDDRHVRVNGVGGAGSAAVVGRMIKLGPVAKTRNSSLTLAEHRSYLLLCRKEERFLLDADGGSARPLTAEERQALQRLVPLVRAEQQKYGEVLNRWVEAGRSPYKLLDKTVGPAVDAYVAAIKARQKRALPRWYRRLGTSPLPDVFGAEANKAGDLKELLPPPAYRDTVKGARPREAEGRRGVLLVPEELPVDIPNDKPLRLSEAAAARLVDRMPALGGQDWIFEDADVLVDVPTLLELVDPNAPWTVPFTVRSVGGEGRDAAAGEERRVLVLHSPLLHPTLSMRARADLYYGEAVPAELRRLGRRQGGQQQEAEEEEAAPVDPGADPCLSLEAWQLAHLRVVVASDRLALSRAADKSRATTPHAEKKEEGEEEVTLEAAVDYTLDWSEEEERPPMDVVRPLLHAAFTSGPRPLLATVDGRHSRLARMAPREGNHAQMADARTISKVVESLRRVLSRLHAQPAGRYVARHDPGRQALNVYHHAPDLDDAAATEAEGGGGGDGDGGADVLDLHAVIDVSAQPDPGAMSSYRRWVWPSQGSDHIPGTFVPRT